jgi:hypothetical protein
MDEERFLEVTAKVMSDSTPLPLTIQIKEAWLLISGLQFLTRNPHLGKPTLAIFAHIAKQFQSAIVKLHPEANPLIEMGWDERFDVDRADGVDVNAPAPAAALKPVNNCWTIYTSEKEDEPSLAQIGRPQDWGDPRWMYRVYTLEAQGYRNTVHCWVDQQIKDHEHLQLFAPLVATIMLPGWPVERSGRDYLTEDDFWSEAWGEMPPYAEDDEDDYDFNY